MCNRDRYAACGLWMGGEFWIFDGSAAERSDFQVAALTNWKKFSVLVEESFSTGLRALSIREVNPSTG
jgi:hypothetical protein